MDWQLCGQRSFGRPIALLSEQKLQVSGGEKKKKKKKSHLAKTTLFLALVLSVWLGISHPSRHEKFARVCTFAEVASGRRSGFADLDRVWISCGSINYFLKVPSFCLRHSLSRYFFPVSKFNLLRTFSESVACCSYGGGGERKGITRTTFRSRRSPYVHCDCVIYMLLVFVIFSDLLPPLPPSPSQLRVILR